MNAYILVGIALVLVVSAIFAVRRFSVSNNVEKKKDLIDDSGDDLLWEVGQKRPITTLPDGSKAISTRNFLRSVAGALVVCGAFAASKGANLPFAEKMALAADAKGRKRLGKRGSTLAGNFQPGHVDGFHVDEPNHGDSGSGHADSESGHIDSFSHYDQGTPHQDHETHTDGPVHSDSPGDHDDTNNHVDFMC